MDAVNPLVALALVLGIGCLVAPLVISFAKATADTSSTPAGSFVPTDIRARGAADPDLTILGRRADNDEIFGSWPALRVPDRTAPPVPDTTEGDPRS